MKSTLQRFGARIGLAAAPDPDPVEEIHDPSHPAAEADHDFESVGPTDSRLLLAEGLRPTDTILDFGCRAGHLAAEIIPKLFGGHYIGVDLSGSMLDKARARVSTSFVQPSTRVTWIKQSSYVFPLSNQTVDMFCAFDAFMHMEHEDVYRYLKNARRVVKPAGRLLLSCLPITLPLAQSLFLDASQHGFAERWNRRRTVVTSTELMEHVAWMAGWTPLRWHAGDERNIKVADQATRVAVGSTLVLENPADR